MNARVADQVVVELRMLVDQHVRAGRRAREEFERNIGGMASVADRSAAKQAAALDKAAGAAEKAEGRKRKAAESSATAQARADEKQARFILQAQRRVASLVAVQEKAAAREQAARERAAAAAERAAARKTAADEKAAAAALRSAERAAAARSRAEQQRSAMVLRLQRAMEGAQQREAAAAERSAQRQAAQLAAQARAQAAAQTQGLARVRGGLMGGVSAIGLGALVGGGALAIGAVGLTRYSDAWTNVRNKVSSAGVALAEVPRVQEQIYQQAQKTRTSLETQANLFQRVSIAAKELNRSREEVFRFNEIVSKSFKVGGATAAEASGSAIQLTQGLGSGVLQGDELRSIKDNSQVLAQAIAKEFNTTVGGLKKLGETGQLVSDRVFKAILSAGGEIDDQFEKLIPTFEDFRTRVDNAFTRFVGLAATAAGTSREFASAADGLVRTFEDPEVIQAAADALTEIVAAIKPMLGLIGTLARNWELFIAIGAAFVALRLIDTILGLASAIRVLAVAAAANPITALLAGGAALVGYIYEVTDGFKAWSAEARKTAAEQDALNARINQLSALHPDVVRIFDAVRSGAMSAAEGIRQLSADARQAAADLVRMEIAKNRLAELDVDRQAADAVASGNSFRPDSMTAALVGRPQDANRNVSQELDDYRIKVADTYRAMLNGDASPEAFAQAVADGSKAFTDYNPRLQETVDKVAELARKRADLNITSKALADLDQELQHPTSKPPVDGGGGGTGAAPASGGKGKGAKEKESSVEKFLRDLKDQTAQLGLSNTALKEAELRAQAEGAAREDLNKKLRASADLRAEEIAQIESSARLLTNVPAIIGVAKQELPGYAAGQQRAQLMDMAASLGDPKVIAALKEQGLTAADAGKAIDLQLRSIDTGAQAAADAITGIGDAFTQGVQGAQSLDDALAKVGVTLLNMLAQAALLGKGPLGGLFEGLLGSAGGLAGLIGGGGSGLGSVLGAAGSALSLISGRAGGGPVKKGQPYIVGEKRAELFVPDQSGRIIPKVPDFRSINVPQSVIPDATARGAFNPTVNSAVNVTVQSQGGDAQQMGETVARIAAPLVDQRIQQALRQQNRPGGANRPF